MDPLLIFAASIVGFDAFLAYFMALGKTFLKKQLASLEKRQEETAQKLVVLTRRKKSLEGTRKFLRKLREERMGELRGLTAECQKWESGEVPAEFASDAEEGEEGVQEASGDEGQMQEPAAEGEGAETAGAEGEQTAGAGGSTEEDGTVSEDAGDEEEEEKDIKVKAPLRSRNVNFGPRHRRINPE